MRISYWSADVCSSDLPALQESKAGAVGERIFGEGGLFGRHFDRVAVERRLDRDAIFDRAFGRRALFGEVERLGEIEVAGLVVRRGGIGDVRGEHHQDRKSVVWGKSVSVRVKLGGR